MALKIVCCTSLLVLSLYVFPASSQAVHQPGAPDFCVAGPFHPESPHPESQEFDECLSWEDKACCTVEVPKLIDEHKAVGLYNYSWDLCGELSQECETFIKDEECFYQCEPMLGYFQINNTGYISHVPVCASYCDRWFEACRNDYTCVLDWLADFDFAVHGHNTCPENSSCVTFEEMYGDATGLCNRMWGDAFFYSEDEDNCTVMTFTGPNPNFELTFPVTEVPEPTPNFEATFRAGVTDSGVPKIRSSFFMIGAGVFAFILITLSNF